MNRQALMKWCCTAFENHYEMAGERSIAVLVEENSEGRPEFLLQARAFDRGDEPAITTAAPMSLVIETGMRFCPWCGVDLQKCYGKYSRDLTRPGFRIEHRA